MTGRHTAALALVGWYLVTPPPDDGGGAWNQSAPLRAWVLVSSHDSAKECEQAKIELTTEHPPLSLDPAEKQRDGIVHNWNMESLCIATDDSRLKANSLEGDA